MNVYFKKGKILIEIDKDVNNIEEILNFIKQKENKKQNNELFEFLLKHQGELKDNEIASEEELHMQGD